MVLGTVFFFNLKEGSSIRLFSVSTRREGCESKKCKIARDARA